ncbi:hypothetical protein AQJ23_40670 [Streptomyces antibioticus]|nr:hypothetical protein AQJ23_40670 [Streptomyces antibioticus]
MAGVLEATRTLATLLCGLCRNQRGSQSIIRAGSTDVSLAQTGYGWRGLAIQSITALIWWLHP